ncbi:MAG: FGGY-family carbohydrate kinase [Actinomycetales bacterium]
MTAPTRPDGPFVMGIDFGTESCRVAIFNLVGEPIAFAATPYTTTHPRPGWAEQSEDDWWDAIRTSSHQALQKAGLSGADIAGISYDATTMTVLAMDDNGRAMRPAIMWMDVRAVEQAERASSSSSKARRYNGGGTMPATAEWFPFKSAWLKEHEPETFNGAKYLVDAPDWITYKLTGEWTININSASARMYYDRDNGGWPVDFYEDIGVADVLDKIPGTVNDLGVAVGGLTSAAAEHLGLREGTPVAQGCADAFAGQIGLGVVAPGKMALITGSSHVFIGQTDQPISGEGFFGGYTDSVMPGQYTVEGGQVSTGSVVKWYRDNFAKHLVDEAEAAGRTAYSLMDERAAQIPLGSEGLIVNEYFQGNRTPYTDGRARGILWGLSLHHGPAHFYRAILEGVCYGTEHIARTMRAAGHKVDEIVSCGGATNSEFWMQMHADVTGTPITLTKVPDAVALGSCILAATGAGLHKDIPSAADAMVHTADTIEPDMKAHEEYQFYLDSYIDTYPRMQEPIHKMVDHVQ